MVCELDGTLRYEEQETAGSSVTLRTEMDVLVVFSNTPNLLDPSPDYPDAAVEIRVTDAEAVREDDSCAALRVRIGVLLKIRGALML